MTGFLAFFSSLSGDNWFNNLLIIIGAIGGGIIFWLKGKDNLRQGEAGFVLRNGKIRTDKEGNPRLRGPGLILLIPWVDTLWRTSIQQRTQNLGHKLRTQMLNGSPVAYQDIESVVFYRVTDPYKALNESQNMDGQVTSICNKHLQELIGKGRSNKSIHRAFPGLVKEELGRFGVEFIEILFEYAGDTFATQQARSFSAAGIKVTVPFLPAAGGPLAINGNGHLHGHDTIAEVPIVDAPVDTPDLS